MDFFSSVVSMRKMKQKNPCKICVASLFSSFFLALFFLGNLQAQDSRTEEVCENKTFFSVVFEDVEQGDSLSVSVTTCPRCDMVECDRAPVSDTGWKQGNCTFTFTVRDNLSGVHKGVFEGKIRCEVEGEGEGERSDLIAWEGTAELCGGEITEVNDEDDLEDCDQLVKDPDSGKPGSNGCSIPFANALGMQNRNVIFNESTRLANGNPDSGLPCDEHDVCYRTCGSDKEECDTELRDAVMEKCRNAMMNGGINNPQLNSCRMKANAIDIGLNTPIFPQNAYQQGQIDNCSCCEE